MVVQLTHRMASFTVSFQREEAMARAHQFADWIESENGLTAQEDLNMRVALPLVLTQINTPSAGKVGADAGTGPDGYHLHDRDVPGCRLRRSGNHRSVQG